MLQTVLLALNLMSITVPHVNPIVSYSIMAPALKCKPLLTSVVVFVLHAKKNHQTIYTVKSVSQDQCLLMEHVLLVQLDALSVILIL